MFDESLISDTALPGADPPAPAIAAVEPNGAKSAPENSASDIRSALAEFKQTLTDLTRKNMPENSGRTTRQNDREKMCLLLHGSVVSSGGVRFSIPSRILNFLHFIGCLQRILL